MGLLAYLLFEWCNKCYPYRWRNRGLGRWDTLPNKFTQLDSGRTGNHAWGAFMRLRVVCPRVELDTRLICRRFGRWSEASAIMFRGWVQGHARHCWSAVDLGGVGQRLGLQHLWFPVGLLLIQVYESWAFCLSFVAQGVCCFCSLSVLPGLEAVGGKYGSQAIFVSLLHVQPIVVCADLQQLQGHYQK